MQSNIVFKFSRPSGTPSPKPSKSMADALRRLSQSEELKVLTTEAKAHGRKVVVQVFHSAEGHPFLIHLATVDQTTA